MEQNENKKKIAEYSTMNNCIPQETVIKNIRLAAAYVPYQKLCTLFAPLEALKRGTAFPELYSPYNGEDKNHSPLQSSKKGRTYGE
ncbi:spore coat associated protein CotJA [Clostridium algoriphilum]|uniref:spore coat associated protein CotJA n=1 Tax=Clostridium algoriphilum TaxID=198347 RepID=UPI001CF28797|nr:spore coat associated protein CotJA [Clostridium algoriphilum]MCB2295019.1 spore coat associated protein CotJA [Clostridium algoriphilum]